VANSPRLGVSGSNVPINGPYSILGPAPTPRRLPQGGRDFTRRIPLDSLGRERITTRLRRTPGGRIAVDPQGLVLLALQASVFLTVLGFGLEARPDDLLGLVRRPARLARALLAMFVVMPVVAVALAATFAFRPAVEVALVALAISPVPPLLPRRGARAGGRMAYALGLTAWAALLSIVLIPTMLRAFQPWLAKPAAPATAAQLALVTVLLPLGVGMALRAAAPPVVARIARPVTAAAMVLLIGGLLAILGVQLRAIVSLVGNGTVLAIVTFVAAGLAVGHALGGPDDDERVVLALATACRHPGIALAVGSASQVEQRLLMAAILLYLVLNLVVCAPYVVWLRQRAARSGTV
jgi:BASS family bile acid:Na+ symporter